MSVIDYVIDYVILNITGNKCAISYSKRLTSADIETAMLLLYYPVLSSLNT